MDSVCTAVAVLMCAAIAPVSTLAQPAVPPRMSCQVHSDTPPDLRFEGMTELTGNIVIYCTGGQILTAGSVIPTADITVNFAVNVTSRILDKGHDLSEAMLLIDEPGFSPAAAPRIPCLFPQGAGPGGCVQYAQKSNGVPVPSTLPETLTAQPANVFLGSIQASQITFRGVPMLPPGAGSSRTFRIANIRVDVAEIVPGGALQVLALVGVGDLASISSPVQIVGFYRSGLDAAPVSVQTAGITNRRGVHGSAGTGRCGPGTSPTAVGILRFSEKFATAFKVRTGREGGAGVVNNSESGLILPVFGKNAGLADYGTRLKAVFHDVPPGVRLFVSTTNVAGTLAPTMAPPDNDSVTPHAALVPGESFIAAGSLPAPIPDGTANGGATALVELSVSKGSATAVWEVANTNPAVLESLTFGVWQRPSRDSGAGEQVPAVGTVSLSFAPMPPAFPVSDGTRASATLPIGRFSDGSVPMTFFSVAPCWNPLPSTPRPRIAGGRQIQ
jgi:hypothetical protein